MNKNTTGITYSAYFNDIVIGFYEDERLVAEIGKKLGFDIYCDYFIAMSFLYPSDTVVSLDEKEILKTALPPIVEKSPCNKEFKSNQFILTDKGIVLFLVAHCKEDLLSVSPEVRDMAVSILDGLNTEKFVRVGIGTIETGISGIITTYNNALQAVRAGETFKKERRVLDYMGMEIYSAINTMVIKHGEELTRTILKQLTDKEQLVLGRYYKCKEIIADTAKSLDMTEEDVFATLTQVKKRTGLDVHDTEDNFKLNFIMIAKKVLDKEKKRK